MEIKNVITWILLISTFLIAGKALKLLDISWIIAFGPVTLLIISFLVIFVVSFIYMYKSISKKIEEDGE